MSLERSPEAESLGSRAAGGVLWGVLQKWAQRLGGLVTIGILARLLEPADFGVVAVAASFIPVVYLLSDLGFSTYIVQMTDISPRVLSTAFWFSTTAGAGLAGLVAISAPSVAAFLRVPDAGPVIAGVAPSIVFVGLSSVPISLMRRRMEFRTLALQSGAAAAIGQIAAVALALSGAGAWALVAQLLLNHVIVALLAIRFARFRPRCTFSTEHFIAMTKFGTNVTGVEFSAMARVWVETAIVTLALGVSGLGYLNIAQRLVQTAQDLSSAAVVPVSTVVFAHVRDASERLTRAYRRALETIYIIVMPIMIVLAVGAGHVIPLVFGPGWTQSVHPTTALSVAAVLTLGASLDNGLFYGAGRPGRWLIYAVITDALTVATTAFAVRYGITGVSVGFVFVAGVATVVRWFLVARLLGVGVGTVASPFARTLLPALVSTCVGVGVYLATRSWSSDVLGMIAITIAVALAQLAATRSLAPVLFSSTLRLLLDRLPSRLKRHAESTTTRGGHGDEFYPDQPTESDDAP